jgi:hypothetical protein
MPLAGESAKSRARAHYRWGARYLRDDEPRRASAHFGRAEHYMTMFGTQHAYSLGNEADWDLYSPEAVKARELRTSPLQRLRKETDLLVADLKYAKELLRDKVKDQERHAQRLIGPGQKPDQALQHKAQNAANGLTSVTDIISMIDRMYDEYATLREEYKKIEILNEIQLKARGGLSILQIANPDRMAVDMLNKAKRMQESESDDEEDTKYRKRAGQEDGELSGSMDKMQLL